MTEVINADVIKAYAEMPQDLIEGFGDEGDMTHKYLLNPAIFSLLGDVKGKRILREPLLPRTENSVFLFYQSSLLKR